MFGDKSIGEGENDKGGQQVDVNKMCCRGLLRSLLQHRIMCHHSCPLQYLLAPFTSWKCSELRLFKVNSWI